MELKTSQTFDFIQKVHLYIGSKCANMDNWLHRTLILKF